MFLTNQQEYKTMLLYCNWYQRGMWKQQQQQKAAMTVLPCQNTSNSFISSNKYKLFSLSFLPLQIRLRVRSDF